MKSLVPVTENNGLLYISGFPRNSGFICNKHTLIFKVVTYVIEASFTQAFNRMLTSGWHLVIRQIPGHVSPKLRVHKSIQLCRVVSTLSKFKNPGVCCCKEKTQKISGEDVKGTHLTK